MWKNSIKKFKLYFHWRMASIIWSTNFWDFGGKHEVYKFPCPKYWLYCSKDGKKIVGNIFWIFFLPVCIWGWFSWRYFIQTLILAIVVITPFFLDLGTLWIYYEACYGTDETTFLRLKEPFLQGGRPNIMGFILTMVHRDMIFFPNTSPAFQTF